MSGSHAPFKPFQSGCSLCKPSSDYTNYYQNAGGNYSKQGLIPRQASSSGDLNYNGYSNSSTNKASANLMSNYGKSYQTTGGKKRKPKAKKSKPKAKRSKSKKLSKSTLNKIKDLGKLLGIVDTAKKVVRKSVKTGRKVVRKSVSTGRKVVRKSVNTGRKVVRKSLTLGRKVVKRSMNLGRKILKPTKRKTTKRKTTKRKQRGGDTNWGATGMPARYYDPNVAAPNVSSSVYNADTPYGKFSPTSLGKDCNLFPFNPYENPPTSSLLTGGRRKKKSVRKNCSGKKKCSVKKKKSSRGKKQRGGLCLQQGKDLLSSAGGFPYSPRWGKEHCGGRRKKSSPKKKRSRK